MTYQKDIFRASEGDAWFQRNEAALAIRDLAHDPIVRHLSRLSLHEDSSLLEIGCSNGRRLKYIAEKFGWRVAGVDPSATAIKAASEIRVPAVVGTADQLPFSNAEFDVVVFGFCLYLCDDVDLFRIATEADRVLKNPGWLIILDFDSSSPRYKRYHHREGIATRKMDYKSMFEWHPFYSLASYEKEHHSAGTWSDSVDEWVSTSILRKSMFHPGQANHSGLLET